MQEYQPSIAPVANEFLVRPILCENGELVVPEGPGLGLEFDVDKIKYYTEDGGATYE